MKVAELLEQRRQNWIELERLCDQLEKRSRRALGAETVSRFATLYRAACADLALADAYQLPPNTVNYLHQLVGQAHNQLYRSRKFNPRLWLYQMLYELPPRLFRDNSLRLAFVLFWGVFLASMFMAFTSTQYSEQVLTKEGIASLEEMYAEPISGRSFRDDAFMTALYQWHNTGIGLRCLAAGVLFGIGGIFELIFNAGVLGAAFGHMATIPERKNFFEFVTAHGPFELTAIVLSAAGGMRLGFSLIYTQGLSRVDSLRRAGYEAIPTISAAIILFGLAAVIEGFISPSAAPYWVKAGVAGASSLLMLFYFVFLGWQPNAELNLEEPTPPSPS
jgi:uncharacterized membrane protein SpoIIM required for sporulation